MVVNSMKLSLEQKTHLLLGLFIASLIGANILGTKIFSFFEFDFFGFTLGPVSVGILFMPVLFLVTDIVEEVFGKQKTQQFVNIGLLSLIFVLFIVAVSVALPPASRTLVSQETYSDVFGKSIRIMLASIISFYISQMHDLWAFNFWKQKTNGKFLWLRNNLSTIASTFIDTVLFMFLAFYYIPMDFTFLGIDFSTFASAPNFDFFFVMGLVIPYWLAKIALAFIDTPFCYLGVRWLKGSEKKSIAKSV
jgi:queuosine precursor transporter